MGQNETQDHAPSLPEATRSSIIPSIEPGQGSGIDDPPGAVEPVLNQPPVDHSALQLPPSPPSSIPNERSLDDSIDKVEQPPDDKDPPPVLSSASTSSLVDPDTHEDFNTPDPTPPPSLFFSDLGSVDPPEGLEDHNSQTENRSIEEESPVIRETTTVEDSEPKVVEDISHVPDPAQGQQSTTTSSTPTLPLNTELDRTAETSISPIALPIQQSTSLTPSDQPISDVSLRQQISELADQVTQMNNKLVRSFDRISNLEDELHEALEINGKLRNRNQVLETESAQHKEALKGGLLVERANVQSELHKLTQRVIQESEKRSKSEASLSSINKELDDLSASLFSEANRLVAAEKLKRLQAERKVLDVEESMRQVEEAIEARRDQLDSLRVSLEEAERERDQYKTQLTCLKSDSEQNSARTPSLSPTLSAAGGMGSSLLMRMASTHLLPIRPAAGPNPEFTSVGLSIVPPTPKSGTADLGSIYPAIKFSHDITPFTEFLQFIAYLRRTRSEALARPLQPTSISESYYSAAAAMTHVATTPSIKATAAKDSSLAPPKDWLAAVLPLSQHLSQPFLKRCIEEDSDPALRLDIAPGLNFISRRVIMTSLLEGHLVIEPVWSDHGSEYEKCTLCGCSLKKWLPCRGSTLVLNGETTDGTLQHALASNSTVRKMFRGSGWNFGPLTRPKRVSSSASSTTIPIAKSAENWNTAPADSGPGTLTQEMAQPVYVHTFRASESASTKYPICPTYCLVRLRSVCDFWTLLRSIQSALLRGENLRLMRYVNQQDPITHLGLGGDNNWAAARTRGKSLDLAMTSTPTGLINEITEASSTNQNLKTQELHISDSRQTRTPVFNVGDEDKAVQAHAIESAPVQPGTDQPLSECTNLIRADKIPEHSGPLKQESDSATELGGVKPADGQSPACPFPVASRPLESSKDESPDAPSKMDSANSITEQKSEPQTPGHPIVPPPVPRRSAARSQPAPVTATQSLVTGILHEPSHSSDSTSEVASSSPSRTRLSGQSLDAEANAMLGSIGHKENTSPVDLDANHRPVPSATAKFLKGHSSQPQSMSRSQSSLEPLETGWEEKCWCQILKCKEDMFYKRLGIYPTHETDRLM